MNLSSHITTIFTPLLAVLLLSEPAGFAQSNVWSPIPTNGAPTGREYHTAVWTGSEMIVWGGASQSSPFHFADGGRYSPASNQWTSVPNTNVVAGRYQHSAVWTGTEMIVWGGYGVSALGTLESGARFDPVSRSWTALSTASGPGARGGHTALWTGHQMIVFGGFDGNSYTGVGALYSPTNSQWSGMTFAGAPTARGSHTAVWTGSEMIVWGGTGGITVNTGKRYDPASNLWSTVTTTSAPDPRSLHTAIWTGTEMIVWGGFGSGALADGGRYNPMTGNWSNVSTNGAPNARGGHTAVWTGSEMIIWGGYNGSDYFNDGARYNPASNSWTALKLNTAPVGRYLHTAVWSGSEMLVWGGENAGGFLNDGARYHPAADIAGTNSYPPLSIAIAGTNSIMTWVSTQPGLILQQATNLIPPTIWQDVHESTTTNGPTNTVEQKIVPGITNRFFRLRGP